MSVRVLGTCASGFTSVTVVHSRTALGWGPIGSTSATGILAWSVDFKRMTHRSLRVHGPDQQVR